MRASRNTLSGYVEKAHISSFNFENQRRTFHTYGFALDPSVNGEVQDGSNYVGDLQTAYDTEGKTVFESPKAKKNENKRKMMIRLIFQVLLDHGVNMKMNKQLHDHQKRKKQR